MYQKKLKNGKDKSDMTCINSAALQDHFLKQANINLKIQQNISFKPPIHKYRNNSNQFEAKLDVRNKQTFQQSAQSILKSLKGGPENKIVLPRPQINRTSSNNMIQYENEFFETGEQYIQENQGVIYRQILEQQQQIEREIRQNQNGQSYNRQNSGNKLNQTQARQKTQPKSIRVGHQKIYLENQKDLNKKNSIQNRPYQKNGLDFEKYTEQRQFQDQNQDSQKMKKYYSNLTLAQRLGLVDSPEKPLSLDDWDRIEQQSKKRQDSEGQCAICLDEFKDQEQVLLSCSHVFHKKCLSSFERHNKIKTCPICRRKDYDKKIFDEGFKVYVIKCAIKIQKIWRGGKDREKFFSELIENKYKSDSLLLRRKILGYKLVNYGKKMYKAIEEKKAITNEFLNQQQQILQQNQCKLEDNIESLRQEKQKNKYFMNEILKNYYQQNHSQESQEHTIYDNNQINVNIPFSEQEEYKKRIEQNQIKNKKLTEQEWNEVKRKAMERNEHDCAICFNSLQNNQKSIYLLSCTHIFHASCLNAFERYNLTKIHDCPVCRSEYQKYHIMQKNTK